MKRQLLSWVIIILGTYLLINTIRNLWRLHQARQLVGREQQKVEQLAEENQQLTDRLEAVSTDQFVEQQARDKLNMAKPGETTVLVPKELLETLSGDQPRPVLTSDREDLPNWLQWWLVFTEGVGDY
jgi:cell division protein FtsB